MDARFGGDGPGWMPASGTDEVADVVTCSVCGQPLDGDPDDDPGTPPAAVCGECVRAREFDETLWELDLADPGDGLW